MTSAFTAIASVLVTSLLAWFIGSRISYGWDEVKRQRESDLAALESFYSCYGKFFGAWKLWDVYQRSAPTQSGSFPSDERAWSLLRDAEEAEAGFEAILVKLASEYSSSQRDRRLFAAFRQGAQSLREAMRAGNKLTWKAQAHSHRDHGHAAQRRVLDYRKYRAFKALCEYVATTLALGPDAPREGGRSECESMRPGHSWTSRKGNGPRLAHSLLGARPLRTINRRSAINALLEITATEGVAPNWYEIAEADLQLDPVPERPTGW
jgi:hypothetical protein